VRVWWSVAGNRLALGNDALYFQMHLRELASHRMDKRDECRRSIRDLRVMLDPLATAPSSFSAMSRFSFSFSASSHHDAELKVFTDAQRPGPLDEAADR
jgi:hypothetical protein